MKFVFQSYPTHPWIAEWSFEPRGCTTTYRQNRSDHFFTSLQTVGQVAPHVDRPDWKVQIPVPQNSRINLLGNGFCAYFEHRRIRCGAEVLSPEPGVLWGRFLDIPEPTLLSDLPIEQKDNTQWIEAGVLNAMLCVRNNAFCLVSSERIYTEALKKAESYLQEDFEQHLEGELDNRSGAMALFEGMAHHDSLTVISLEAMRKALRPPEGKIPHVWSQSSTTDTACFEINELFPLALAWSLVDPETAEELVLCALKIQTNSGALPVHLSPYTTFSLMEAPKPLLAKTAEYVWNVRKNQEFLETILPLLRRHLQWSLHHFDPKRRGQYSWKHQSEPLAPGLYKTDLATVDLAVLLLTEINAVNRLRKAAGDQKEQAPYFEEQRIELEQSIVNRFWNDNESAFTNALLRDIPEKLYGFPQISPLLWSNLPHIQKAAILERIRESETLPGQYSTLSWRQSSMEGSGFPLLQQLLFLHALKTADPNATVLSDFSRLTIQGFVEWHTLSLQSSNTLQINPVIAAFILNVQAMHKYRHHSNGRTSSRISGFLRKFRIDRTDLMIVAGTLLLLFCINTYFEMRKAPPPLAALETQMNNAYAVKDINLIMNACRAIITHYPENAARARLLAANTLMLAGENEQAAELFKQVRSEYPDSPGAMISLGLAEQLNGNFTEAGTNYYEFCYLFDVIFPQVVEEVSQFDYLMREGFQTPPNWQKIYRYQFMHEL